MRLVSLAAALYRLRLDCQSVSAAGASDTIDCECACVLVYVRLSWESVRLVRACAITRVAVPLLPDSIAVSVIIIGYVLLLQAPAVLKPVRVCGRA